MKTSSYQTIEPSRSSIHTFNDLSISFQKTASRISSPVGNTNCRLQAFHPSTDYLQLVQQSEQYMMEHGDQTISIERLCAVLYVSRRTLHNAFREVVGIAPITYLKMQRMKQVYRQLEQAHPLTTTVFDTACQWGFCHMGHFSKDYKQMFGESPSDTLRRTPTFR